MINKLSIVAIKNYEPGQYGDGGGLWLVKSSKEKGKWVFRYNFQKRSRSAGLGGYPLISLKEARVKAENYRKMLSEGKDPISVKKVSNVRGVALVDIVEDMFSARKHQLKNAGKDGRWLSPLKRHVLPKIGDRIISEITQNDIRECFKSIWLSKHETAQKAMGRLSIAFRHAAAMGIDVDIQAVAKAKLLLGKPVIKSTNISSMPYSEIPKFYEGLSYYFVGHLALKLLILTGARSLPVRFMKFSEVQGGIWTIPAENMKGKLGKVSDFRIPLSKEALCIISLAKLKHDQSYVFSNRNNKPISGMTLIKILNDRGLAYRPHGFRSSLRNWMAEQADIPYEVAETVLSHVIGSKIQRAYLRTDFIEQRAVVMEKWANFISGS